MRRGHHRGVPPQSGVAAEKRYESLFSRLDKDGDGRISVHELKEGIDDMGLPSMSGTAQVGAVEQGAEFTGSYGYPPLGCGVHGGSG